MRNLLPLGLILGGLLLALGLSGCYVTSQGVRYLALLARASRNDRLLADPRTPPASAELLRRAERIRRFARDELGLRDTKNFRSLVELDRDYLASVVQACAELSFTRKLWSYPLVGKLPYRGYFDPRDAEREAARLRREGWDVIVRPVDAFSTLGFFPDPLWSFMANYEDGALAETLLHELCHATAFRKGAEDWNEELATFVGREGALAYLVDGYGPEAPELAAYRAGHRDAEAFAGWLRETARELEAVYAGAGRVEEKRERKREIIQIRAKDFSARAGELFETEGYRSFPMERLNNAYLDLFRLYEGESRLYRDYYERISGGKLPAFIADMARLGRSAADPKALMRARLAELSPPSP